MPRALTEEERHKRIKARIERCVKWTEERYHQKWDRFVDLYANRPYDGQGTSDQERVAVATAFAIVNVIVPAVSHNYPRIQVDPERQEDVTGAPIVEAVINHSWRKLKVKREVSQAVKDAVIMGTGITKTGWRRSERDLQRTPRAMKADFESKAKERDQSRENYLTEGQPELAESLPSDDDIWLSIPTTERALTHDDLFVERISPRDCFVDPDATDDRDPKYIFHRVVKTLEQVKANKLYDKKALKDLKADTRSKAHSEGPGAMEEGEDYADDVLRVTLYEYWDIENQTITVYAKGLDRPLLPERDWPTNMLGFQFFFDNTVPDEFWAIGEIESAESQIRELNKTRSQMLTQRRQFNRKVIFKENAFLPQHIDELRSDKDGVFVPVKSNVQLNESLFILQPPAIDAQLYQVDETLRRDITEVTSVSEYQRGLAPNIRRTATEASLIESAASIRAQDKLARVEEFMADIANAMLALMMKFYTDEHVTRVVGKQGQEVWFTYNADLIEGEYSLKVEAGSTQPTNDAQRKLDSLQLFQMLAGHPNVAQEELLRHVLEAHRIPNIEDFIQPVAPAGMPPEMAAAVAGGAPAEGEDPEAGAGGKGLEELLGQIATQSNVDVAPEEELV